MSEFAKCETDEEFKNLSFEQVQERKIILSRKFTAFIICMITGFIAYLFFLFKHNEINSLGKFLDFVTWIFIVYVGGNSAEALTDKLGKKWEKLG